MDFYQILSILLPIAVFFTYLNCRFFRLQTTIAVMVASLMISLVLIISGKLGLYGPTQKIAESLSSLDFQKILLDGMLSFLLFAGALTVDLNTLKQQKWEIAVLATLSTLASSFLIAGIMYYILNFISISMPFLYCLMFGALISPTDPIAVLALCKEVNAPRRLTGCIAGESLFNDGVGIVLFLTIFQITFSGQEIGAQQILIMFGQQTLGGIAFGILLGLVGFWLIKSIDDHVVEVLITIAMVTGGYSLAHTLGLSGPLAMVVAGIFIGNHGRNFSMTKAARQNLDIFWELVDEILNAILFLLIGLELLIVPLNRWSILAGAIAIPVVLAVRFLTVAAPMSIFKKFRKYPPHTIKVLAWGGLRGGLAVALALMLPNESLREFILSMTYAVVVFAVVVQGVTIKPLVEKSKAKQAQLDKAA